MKNHTSAYTSDSDFVPAHIDVKKIVGQNNIPCTLEEYIALRNSEPNRWAYLTQIERLVHLNQKIKELHENIDSYQYLLWLYYWWKSIKDRITVRHIQEYLEKTYQIVFSYKSIERFFNGLGLDLAPKTSVTTEWVKKIKGTLRNIQNRTQHALGNA